MLKSTEILQIDATVIAGILVLLTLIFTAGGSIQHAEPIERGDAFQTLNALATNPVAWIYLIGIFFSISATFTIFLSLTEKDGKRHTLYPMLAILSFGFMIFGFISLSIGFYLIGDQLLFKPLSS